MRQTDQMGGFLKGLAVIEAFGQGRRALTIAEAARIVNLDRAAVRRCLLSLVKAGYAASDGRYFELTPRVLRLGHAYLSAPLPTLIQPSLDRLADAILESCSASILDGAEVVYLARASHHHIMGAGLHPGSRLPAYCTSMGRVLLAALPPEQSRAIIEGSERTQITSRTLTRIDDLMQELQRVRTQGYALVDQELAVGSRSIALPIRNIAGKTVAAINVAAHTSRASLTHLRQAVLPAMQECQASLAQILP
ncbi:MAG: helix-turn-helix domain-containing protein [Hydrogenophilaceae bacterium]|nr:helix-turn-helix domain-containing protein [Hydrogenophilaceae bacterium]